MLCSVCSNGVSLAQCLVKLIYVLRVLRSMFFFFFTALIVINPANFQALKLKLCQSMLTQEQSIRMGEALRDLMVDVEPNLSGKNRDLFTQRLSTFRHTVQSIQNNATWWKDINWRIWIRAVRKNQFKLSKKKKKKFWKLQKMDGGSTFLQAVSHATAGFLISLGMVSLVPLQLQCWISSFSL